MIDRAVSKVYHKEWIDKFYMKYPLLLNQEPRYYAGKCRLISVLFAELLVTEFKIKNVNILVGWNLSGEDTSWLTNLNLADKLLIKLGIGQNEDTPDRSSHAAVEVEGVVYDMSSKQMTSEHKYSIYPTKEFVKRWKRYNTYQVNSTNIGEFILKEKHKWGSNIRKKYANYFKDTPELLPYLLLHQKEVKLLNIEWMK